MDIRFLAKLESINPTTFEAGYACCNELIEVAQKHTSAYDRARPEEAISGTYLAFMQLCEEAGYDPIAVAETILARNGKS